MSGEQRVAVRETLHASGERRLLVLLRPDGLFTYIELRRVVLEVDPDTGDFLAGPPDDRALSIETVLFERNAQGRPTGVCWFELWRSRGGLFGNAEEAEEYALAALPGYRTLN